MSASEMERLREERDYFKAAYARKLNDEKWALEAAERESVRHSDVTAHWLREKNKDTEALAAAEKERDAACVRITTEVERVRREVEHFEGLLEEARREAINAGVQAVKAEAAKSQAMEALRGARAMVASFQRAPWAHDLLAYLDAALSGSSAPQANTEDGSQKAEP